MSLKVTIKKMPFSAAQSLYAFGVCLIVHGISLKICAPVKRKVLFP